MLDWRREWESVSHGYMCILVYVKLIQCSGFPEIYVQLEEGVRLVCNGYMCILLYVKFIQCRGVAQMSGQLEDGSWVSLPWYVCTWGQLAGEGLLISQ